MRRLFVLFTALALNACSTRLNPNACGNQPRDFCGPDKYCVDVGDQSGCFLIPADPSKCESEKWPGQCTAAARRDAAAVTDGPLVPVMVDAVSPDTAVGETTADRGSGSPDAGVDGVTQDASPGRDSGPDQQVPPDATADVPPDVTVCTATCTVGERRCQSGGVQECVTRAGCPGWGQPEPCGSPKVCTQNGTTASCTCPATCTVGSRKCGTSGGLQECAVQTGGCAGWGPETACPQPQVCTAGSGSASCICPAGCVPGATRCGPTGGGIQQCSSQPGGCTTWSAEMPCGAPKTCIMSGGSGTCSCPTACTVGAKQCGPGGGVQECVVTNGCTGWAPETACQAPPNATATCVAGACKSTCNAGRIECSGNGPLCAQSTWSFESQTVEGWALNYNIHPSADVLSISQISARAGSTSLAVQVETPPSGTEMTVQLCSGSQTAAVANRRVSAWVYIDAVSVPAGSECSIVFDGTTRLASGSMAATARQWFQLTTMFDSSPGWSSVPVRIGVGCSFGNQPWAATLLVDDVRVE